MPKQRIQHGTMKPQVERDQVTKVRVFNPGPAVIPSDSIVRVTTTNPAGGIYQHAQPALSTDTSTAYYISPGTIPIGEYGEVVQWKLLTEQNTAAGAIGDPVYLDGTTPGAITLTAPATPIIVGVVLLVDAAAGTILLKVPWSVGSAAALAAVVDASALPSGATQVAAGAGAGELWVTDTHATLPDGVVLRGV